MAEGSETPPAGDTTTEETLPEIDFENPKVKEQIEQRAKEAIDFHTRAKDEYDTAVSEYKQQVQQLQTQAQQRDRPAQPEGGGFLRDFYKDIEQEAIDDGDDPVKAKADTRRQMRRDYQIVKFARDANEELERKIDQKLEGISGDFHTYREGRAFQDLEHQNPVIGGRPYRDWSPELKAEAERIFQKELPREPPRMAAEVALGRKGGERYFEGLEKDRQAADVAVEGSGIGGNILTPDRVRKSLDGRQLNKMNLDEMTKAFEDMMTSRT